MHTDITASRWIDFRKGIIDCLPTVLGYLSIGFAAGVVERTAGFSMLEIALFSLLLYAGSAQFIAAGMWASGASITAIIFSIFLANLRYLLLSAALAPYFKGQPVWKNSLLGYQLTDETFAVAANNLTRHGSLNTTWMFGLNLTAYLNWFIANIAGGFVGEWIGDPKVYGLDFALPAMFIGLIVLQMQERKEWPLDLSVAAIAILLTLLFTIFMPVGFSVILATLFAATWGMGVERWR